MTPSQLKQYISVKNALCLARNHTSVPKRQNYVTIEKNSIETTPSALYKIKRNRDFQHDQKNIHKFYFEDSYVQKCHVKHNTITIKTIYFKKTVCLAKVRIYVPRGHTSM